MLSFHEAQWFVGFSNLAMIMEQDRRHWLLKTDKKIHEQDTVNGDIFQGIIDNTGSTIIAETQKLPEKNTALASATYVDENMSKIFSLVSSTLPFTYDVNGLSMARIVSTKYPYESELKNYKVQFEDCEICMIPIAGSTNSSDVFAFEFIRTTTAPKVFLQDSNGMYTIEISTEFENLTNIVYYYPLDTFQPIDIENIGGGVYTTIAINSDDFIGYPIFWFTATETTHGPTFHVSSPDIIHYGNPGNVSKYQPNIYFGLSDKEFELEEYTLKCTTDSAFTDSDMDFNIPISNVILVEIATGIETPVIFTIDEDSSESDGIIYMSKNVGWEYIDETTYQISMEVFSSNQNDSENRTTLIPAFHLQLDTSIPFDITTTDTGYVGMQAFSNRHEYPYNLNEWDGLPEWFTSDITDETLSQRLALYAIHNTPQSSEEVPSSKQTAALLFDPGKPATSDELSGDEIGRVYVLSNDEAKYENNHSAQFPKPDRTVARICDIPTSVVQLANISGIAPSPIVDKKYVRSEASYSEEDLNRLYNTLADRWVKPTHLASGTALPVYGNMTGEDNEFVFQTMNGLNAIDMLNYNDFREWTNLNQSVDPSTVSVYRITNGGNGYTVGDIGTIIVGGFAFNYIVSEINETTGEITNVSISPADNDTTPINMSNFDFIGESGITSAYGSSPLTSNSGTGLKLQLQVANYSDLLPKKGNIRSGLFAMVRVIDGLWLYTYDTTMNKWKEVIQISQYEASDPTKSLSTKDSFINSIIPQAREISIAQRGDAKETTSIQVVSTPTFVNIVDTTKTPVYVPTQVDEETEKMTIDMNKFYCHTLTISRTNAKTIDAVKAKLTELGVFKHFDCYVIWQWVSNSINDFYFRYGIIQRSFNNLVTTDVTTMLPENSLNSPQYVHTNSATTVVWDVKHVGPMMWTFNPASHIHEKYSLDAETHELYVEHIKINWKDIEVYTDNFRLSFNIIDDNDKFAWYVLSNDGYIHHQTGSEPIYQSPEWRTIANVGDSVDDETIDTPQGNWQLIYPRIQSFTFKNDTSGVEYTPIHMNVLRVNGLLNNAEVLNSENENVNFKTAIIDNNSGTLLMKLFNGETSTWDTI